MYQIETPNSIRERANHLENQSKTFGIALMNLGFAGVYLTTRSMLNDQTVSSYDDSILIKIAALTAFMFTEGLVSYQSRERPGHFTYSTVERLTNAPEITKKASTLRRESEELTKYILEQ
ncbi:MAG: hypothetical protein AABW82_01685 [Nanoarchaeota archaeon]